MPSVTNTQYTEQTLQTDLLSGKRPRPWKYVVFFSKHFEHPIKIPCQQIFSTNLTHAGKMIDFLQSNRAKQSSQNVQYPVAFRVLNFYKLQKNIL